MFCLLKIGKLSILLFKGTDSFENWFAVETKMEKNMLQTNYPLTERELVDSPVKLGCSVYCY